MLTIITPSYELYEDELLIPTIKTGWGGETLRFMRTIPRPAGFTLEQWRDYALNIANSTK